jgi:hypothetical protein
VKCHKNSSKLHLWQPAEFFVGNATRILKTPFLATSRVLEMMDANKKNPQKV